MFKLFMFACMLAVAVAEPKPDILYGAYPYAGYTAPYVYSAAYAAPYAYSAGYTAPYAYSTTFTAPYSAAYTVPVASSSAYNYVSPYYNLLI